MTCVICGHGAHGAWAGFKCVECGCPRDSDRSGEAGETPQSGSTAGKSAGRESGIAQ